MKSAKIPVSRLLLPVFLSFVGLGLLACSQNDDNGGSLLTSVTPFLTCSVDRNSTTAGSSEPVIVTAVLTGDGFALPGVRVDFETTLGQVNPSNDRTSPTGRVEVDFFPERDIGTTIITAAATVNGERVTATCAVAITASTADPLLIVGVTSPTSLAAIEITVQYNTTLVELPRNAVLPLGNFADAGCLSELVDDGLGKVTFALVCAENRGAAGSSVARYEFENIGGVLLGSRDFVVACKGWDESGDLVTTSCSKTVL